MKNTLSDLNNYLFEQLERLNDDDLEGSKLKTQLEKSKAIANIAGKIIDNGRLAIAAKQVEIESAGMRDEYQVKLPDFLGGENGSK